MSFSYFVIFRTMFEFVELRTHSHFQDVEINKAQDIYQLGLILYELCHKMPTMHQRNVLFKKLLKERELSKDCPL